jgi:TPR repeat protein
MLCADRAVLAFSGGGGLGINGRQRGADMARTLQDCKISSFLETSMKPMKLFLYTAVCALLLLYVVPRFVYAAEQNIAELQKAAEQGDASAQGDLARAYWNGTGVAQDLDKAITWAKKASDQGDAKGQNIIGIAYASGLGGFPKDERKAVEWWQKAVAQGFAPAQYNFGVAYMIGQGGLAKDERKAVEWYQKAAEQGFAYAQNDLGVAYENGSGGLVKDERKAVEWYQKAAEQGNILAQYNLGFAYFSGQGVAKDERKAVEWYQKAAEQGYAPAQSNLGVAYMIGQGGLAKDDRKAVEWFQKAAEQGNILAQSQLGNAYFTGQGAAKDDHKAVEWWQKAAEQGDAHAQKILALIAQAKAKAEAEAQTQAQRSPTALKKTHTNSIGMEFVLIPAGSFELTVYARNEFAEKSEYHPKITISRPYYLGKYEVTQEQWVAVMGKNPSKFTGRNNPVDSVSWNDVQEFVKRLKQKEGRRYRLPTEAEWEYAARAGTTTDYFFAEGKKTIPEADLAGYAWFSKNSGDKTHPVGQKKPNPWGLYDIYGNVQEWVLDAVLDALRHPYYGDLVDPFTDPVVLKGAYRVNRGGGWRDGAERCGSVYRYDFEPDGRYNSVGFRLALSPE